MIEKSLWRKTGYVPSAFAGTLWPIAVEIGDHVDWMGVIRCTTVYSMKQRRLELFQQFGREYPINKGWEVFRYWQENFCAYYAMGVYQVTVGQE